MVTRVSFHPARLPPSHGLHTPALPQSEFLSYTHWQPALALPSQCPHSLWLISSSHKDTKNCCRRGRKAEALNTGQEALDLAQNSVAVSVLCPLVALLTGYRRKRSMNASSKAIVDSKAMGYLFISGRPFLENISPLQKKPNFCPLFFQTYFWKSLRPLLIKAPSSPLPSLSCLSELPRRHSSHPHLHLPYYVLPPRFGDVLEMSLWKEPGGSRCPITPRCHFGLNPAPQGELQPSPRACPLSRSWSPLKPPAGIPIASRSLSEAQHCDILNLEIPKQICLT